MLKKLILAGLLAFSVGGVVAVSTTPSAAIQPGGSSNVGYTNNIILVDYSDDDEEALHIRKAGENPQEY